MMIKQQVVYANTSGRGRHSFFNFSEIWVKFLKEVQIEAVLSTHVSVSKMCSSSVEGRNLRCGAPALAG